MFKPSRRTFLQQSLAMALFVTAPVVLADDPARIKFRDFYGAGMQFTDQIKALAGKPVIVRGFMAPPLKPDATFFVMTKMPMAICPFCDNEADWPDDIVLVRLSEPVEAVRFNKRIEVQGILELGTEIDKETGFVSLMRITNASFEPV